MRDKDGGQAFPVSLFPGPMGDLHAGEPGMSLRDYFAGQAAMGLLAADARYNGSTTDRASLAADAYATADAMLKERSK